jgi:hypothetical protein
MSNVTPMLTDNIGRDRIGRFTSGPGNIGRPYGAKAKHARELTRLVSAMGPRAVAKLSVALDADKEWAIRLVLQYCLPSGRTIEFEGVEPEDIKQAFINGDLSTDEAKSIATAMEKLKNVQDLDDLRTRLLELEKTLQSQTR